MDTNQKAIATALRKAGATVEFLSDVGGGVPDLLVGWKGINLLMECKDGDRPPSERKLTLLQSYWHNMWRGQVMVVESSEEAIRVLHEIVELEMAVQS